jgi:hypothetical protein
LAYSKRAASASRSEAILWDTVVDEKRENGMVIGIALLMERNVADVVTFVLLLLTLHDFRAWCAWFITLLVSIFQRALPPTATIIDVITSGK